MSVRRAVIVAFGAWLLWSAAGAALLLVLVGLPILSELGPRAFAGAGCLFVAGAMLATVEQACDLAVFLLGEGGPR